LGALAVSVMMRGALFDDLVFTSFNVKAPFFEIM